MEYLDRTDAGRRLAKHVLRFAERNPIVVAMPRGGVPVAAEIAKALGAPLDIAVVRKLGAPQQPEFALGALDEDGVALVNRSAQAATGVGPARLTRLIDEQRRQLEQRTAIYREQCPKLDIDGRTVILVDDGLATGNTAIAAARNLRRRGAAEVILAVPICTAETLDRPPDWSIDSVVCLTAPEPFYGVGMSYRHFEQVTDDEALSLLREARDTDNQEIPQQSMR